MWRLITDPRMTVTLAEIETHWSLDDVADARMALDFRDALEAKARQAAEKRAKARGRKR